MKTENELKYSFTIIELSKVWGCRVHNLDSFSIETVRRFNDSEEDISKCENTKLWKLLTWVAIYLSTLFLESNLSDKELKFVQLIDLLPLFVCMWHILTFYKTMKECRARREKIVENPKWRKFFDTYHALVKSFNLNEWCIHHETGYCKKTVRDQITLRISQLKARQRNPEYKFEVLQERETLIRDYTTAWKLGLAACSFDDAMARR